MVRKQLGLPQGVGVGFRACHFPYIKTHKPAIAWFEVLADDYLCDGRPSWAQLEKLRADYPLALHCRGMSLGSVDKLNKAYFQRLKTLISVLEPFSVSDHAAWTSYNGQYFHELLPLPYNEEVIKHMAGRIKVAQNLLEHKILIKNVVSYLQFKASTLTEPEFLQAIAAESGTSLLLDMNTLYINAHHQSIACDLYFQKISTSAVAQFHLGGCELREQQLADTQKKPISEPVWNLYRQALQIYGQHPTLIEWDAEIPEFSFLQQEAEKAQQLTDGFVYAG